MLEIALFRLQRPDVDPKQDQFEVEQARIEIERKRIEVERRRTEAKRRQIEVERPLLKLKIKLLGLELRSLVQKSAGSLGTWPPHRPEGPRESILRGQLL